MIQAPGAYGDKHVSLLQHGSNCPHNEFYSRDTKFLIRRLIFWKNEEKKMFAWNTFETKDLTWLDERRIEKTEGGEKFRTVLESGTGWNISSKFFQYFHFDQGMNIWPGLAEFAQIVCLLALPIFHLYLFTLSSPGICDRISNAQLTS